MYITQILLHPYSCSFLSSLLALFPLSDYFYCLKSTCKHYLIGVCNDGVYIIYTVVCGKIKGNRLCIWHMDLSAR